MSNTEKLKDYLVGVQGYLLNDELSNKKIIMLSGKWGSGKTHFWQNEIEPNIKEKPNAYISLYGKTSIESIENDLYMQIYSASNNEGNLISKGCSTLLTTYARVFKPLSIIDADESEQIVLKSKHKIAIEALEKNALICFDDFERKSKAVDLNDLFGFITQLALNFDCKVIIILNSDVFEGEDKNIFTNVKEKTVSKYLMFNPTCEELFEIIFKDKKYEQLKKYEEVLKSTFKEVNIVNARILMQVLDNILEWIRNEGASSNFYLKYFVFTNINFILNHHIFETKLEKIDKNPLSIYDVSSGTIVKSSLNYENQTDVNIKSEIDFQSIKNYISSFDEHDNKFIENLKQKIQWQEKENGTKSGKADNSEILLTIVSENESLIKSLHFMYCFKPIKNAESNNDAEVSILNDINNFIETGIL